MHAVTAVCNATGIYSTHLLGIPIIVFGEKHYFFKIKTLIYYGESKLHEG